MKLPITVFVPTNNLNSFSGVYNGSKGESCLLNEKILVVHTPEEFEQFVYQTKESAIREYIERMSKQGFHLIGIKPTKRRKKYAQIK